MCRNYTIPPVIRYSLYHRDKGPGFTHFDGPDCGCKPHRIPDIDVRPVDEIVTELEAKERPAQP
jgi:hypothetical protein